MSYSIDRLIWQYRDRPNIKALIVSMMSEYDTLDDVMDQLRTRLDIDASTGLQLDGIGEIIGQIRPNTVQIDDDDVFSFWDSGAGKGFSGFGFPSIGGRWIGINGLVVGEMPDDDYRNLLKAIIIANSGFSDVDQILRFVTSVTGVGATLTEGVGFVDVTFDEEISNVTINLIRSIIPTAAGVSLRNVT